MSYDNYSRGGDDGGYDGRREADAQEYGGGGRGGDNYYDQSERL